MTERLTRSRTSDGTLGETPDATHHDASDQSLQPTAADTSTPALPPVRAGIDVSVPPETAFRAFTTDFDRWWPRQHHIGAADLAQACLEPRAGGRFYERGVDGSECDWGEVLVWDPPRRLVLTWGIDGEWAFRPGLENASRVEITFTPLGDGRTRVELVHSDFERHARTAATVRDAVSAPGGGWPGLMHLFAEHAESA